MYILRIFASYFCCFYFFLLNVVNCCVCEYACRCCVSLLVWSILNCLVYKMCYKNNLPYLAKKCIPPSMICINRWTFTLPHRPNCPPHSQSWPGCSQPVRQPMDTEPPTPSSLLPHAKHWLETAHAKSCRLCRQGEWQLQCQSISGYWSASIFMHAVS